MSLHAEYSVRPASVVAIPTLLLLWSCHEPTRVVRELRAPLESLAAPDAVPALTAVTVTVEYVRGACYELLSAPGVIKGEVLELEVILRDTSSPGSACPDIAIRETTTVTFSHPPAGALTIRGLQPSEPPLERPILVGQ